MRQSHLILSNAIIMWASRVLVMVPHLILVPYLIGTIGESGYGIYALVWSLFMSINQLQVSLQSGVIKYSAAFLAQGRMDEVNRVISSSFVYSILLAVLSSAGILIATEFYKDPSGEMGSSLLVIGIMVLFIVPLTPYLAVIKSRQRYYVDAVTGTVSKFLSLAIIFAWFTFVSPSIEALIIIMAATLFLSKIVQLPIAYSMVPGLRNRPQFFDWRSFRQIVAFGSATVIASMCIAVNSTGVRWIMNAMVSTIFVAHLSIMLMPGMLLSEIIRAMTITVMPAASAYQATENDRMLRELLLRSMRYACILVLAGTIVAALLMKDALRLWVGSEYTFLAPYTLTIFISVGFMMTTSSAHHMLKGMGKLKIVVLIYLLGMIIVPIGLILVVFHIWKNPYVAVTVGLAAGKIVIGCLQICFSVKAVSADLRVALIRIYTQSLCIAAAVYLIAVGAITYAGFDSLVGRICVSILAVLLFFYGLYVFVATAAERQQIRELIRLVWSKIVSIQGLLYKH